MSPDDSFIPVDRQVLLRVLRHLNVIVVSLDRIGSCAGMLSLDEIDIMRNQFMNDWNVFRRLSEARSLLSQYFSDELGDDDMDELEREMADLEYWSYNSRQPTKNQF